ncbi:MAG: hypothetical protein ACI9MC_000252, partial [Kiritimatiellia bacterium]
RPLVHDNYDAKHHVTLARDASWVRYKKIDYLGDLIDWMTLNQLLGEAQLTLRWIADARLTPTGRQVLNDLLAHPQDPLMDLLVTEQMWVTIGRSIQDPIAAINSRELVFRQTKVTITGHISDADRQAHRRTMSVIAGALLTAGREKEGRAITEHILTVDKKAGPQMVQAALEMNEPRRWHRPLLNPSFDDQIQIALELAAALRTK